MTSVKYYEGFNGMWKDIDIDFRSISIVKSYDRTRSYVCVSGNWYLINLSREDIIKRIKELE